MADVKRFCHVCSAVIYDDGFRIFAFYRKIFVVLHFGKIICQKFRVDFQVDESRFYGFNFTDHAVIGHFSTTASASWIGALWYAFAAAIAPLHWYSHRSGRLETETLAWDGSISAAVKAFTSSSLDKIDQFFHNVSLIFFFTAESSVLRFVSRALRRASSSSLMPLF